MNNEQEIYLQRLLKLLDRDFNAEIKRTPQLYDKIYRDLKKYCKNQAKVKQSPK